MTAMMTATATITRPHTARYLVLVNSNASPRALLYGGDHRFLAELDDDGLVLDNLIRAGTLCLPPGELSRACDAILFAPQGDGRVQCFALG